MGHRSFLTGITLALIMMGLLPDLVFAQAGHNRINAEQINSAELARYTKARAPGLRSSAALVMDQREGVVLYGLNEDEQRPIASVTKLMTAMVTLDADLPMQERITIVKEDRDSLRGSRSRIPIGAVLTRYDLLLAALAASDNRAAAALARTYPGGRAAALRAMNDKARRLGMRDTHYADPAGLHSGSVSTARDLALMMRAAAKYHTVRELSTTGRFVVTDHRRRGRNIELINTNRLVRSSTWNIGLSKTGYISEAGNCLVMETVIGDRPVIIVLLNSWGKLSKYGDANRIRDWLLKSERRAIVAKVDAPA